MIAERLSMPEASVANCRIGLVGVLLALVLGGCVASDPEPDLSRLYNRAAQYHGPERDPVILVPGILGSNLRHVPSDTTVWGAFTGTYADPETKSGARLAALPMRKDTPLGVLQDSVHPAGVLEEMRTDVLGLPVSLDAYVDILRSLGVGGYRDESGALNEVNYGPDHFTCFQFAYDWRRGNAENARRLHAFIEEKRAYVQREYEKRYGLSDYDVEFDIVAHSMGGLLTRYYLRYGTMDLSAAVDTPAVPWRGAEHVDQAVLVGPPNAGSAHALDQLVHGRDFGRFAPEYAPAVLGTFPSLYQLLPRGRHGVLRAEMDTSIVVDSLYAPSFWRRMEWGLADPEQASMLRTLLPDVDGPEARRQVAYDHLRKTLARARRFATALDIPAESPDGLSLSLIAGDAEPTIARMTVNRSTGTLKSLDTAPGDGRVLRSSALMDERVAPGTWHPTLRSPVPWDQVTFLFASHVDMTADPVFTDNLLYTLLERPQ